MFKADHSYIKSLNEGANGWEAGHYPELDNLSLLQIHQRMGSMQRKNGAAHYAHHKHLHHLSTEDLSKKDYSKFMDEVTEAGLPLRWDKWKEDGYIDDVVSQICGSCYAASTTSMINTRMNIISNSKSGSSGATLLDYKQILKCDQYNQGCAGGYPYLVEKFLHDFGMTKDGKCVKETPERLLAVAKESPANVGFIEKESEAVSHGDRKRQRLGKRLLDRVEEQEKAEKSRETSAPDVRVKQWSYTSGYYGKVSTLDMMNEVKQHGPITVGIGGSMDLLHYKSGVYHSTGTPHELEWAPVGHAVVLVGWENDKNGKMNWIVKNSYGVAWGENGYFRIGISDDVHGEQNVNTLTSWAHPVPATSFQSV